MDIQDIYKFDNVYNIKIYLCEISENKIVRNHFPKLKINRETARHFIQLLYFDNL